MSRQSMQALSLADAIVKGAKRRPQGFGGFYDTAGGSDAFGAALDATCLGIDGEPTMNEGACLDMLAGRFPILKDGPPRVCPACSDVMSFTTDALHVIGVHLNDDHRWTRERIASWVRCVTEPGATLTVEEEGYLLRLVHIERRKGISDHGW